MICSFLTFCCLKLCKVSILKSSLILYKPYSSISSHRTPDLSVFYINVFAPYSKRISIESFGIRLRSYQNSLTVMLRKLGQKKSNFKVLKK